MSGGWIFARILRRTLCISTQVGCPSKCAFCLTGVMGHRRNLRVWEILGQDATMVAEAPTGPRPC